MSLAPNVQPIVEAVLDQYTLEWDGNHGLSHWGRVLDNGLMLAKATGADKKVVTLFAFLHDACRHNDGDDPNHGRRGGALAAYLRGDLFQLDDRRLALLVDACDYHTDGLIEADITVQTCWDADRLDLARVDIIPSPHRLCTDIARSAEVRRWANRRAQDNTISPTIAGLREQLLNSGHNLN